MITSLSLTTYSTSRLIKRVGFYRGFDVVLQGRVLRISDIAHAEQLFDFFRSLRR